MALIVVDECGIGIAVGKEGAVIRCKEIKGFPEGLELMIQLGPETTKGFYEGLKDEFDPAPSVVTATPSQAEREAALHDHVRSANQAT